jgi:hypothetical protein
MKAKRNILEYDEIDLNNLMYKAYVGLAELELVLKVKPNACIKSVKEDYLALKHSIDLFRDMIDKIENIIKVLNILERKEN